MKKFSILGMTPPAGFDSKGFWILAAILHFIYSLFGLVFGLGCIIGGIALFLNGIAGKISWTANFLGIESSISDAAPGVILFLVGLFVVWITRFSVESK